MKQPGIRELLFAVAIGLVVGVCAAFGWAKETPEALGFFTFTGALYGGMRRR